MTKHVHSQGRYIILVSLHGLIRGHDLELGRDADTGGQIKYVVELARALAAHPDVWGVDLLTRQVMDSKVSEDYGHAEEKLCDGARIVRIPFGPRRYLRKEVLWPWLDCFTDLTLKHIRNVGRLPDWVHAHYADAGLVTSRLSALIGVPLVFTGHSLGYEKQRRLREKGMEPELIESRYHISQRIEAEERALSAAAVVVASTRQEADQQYSQYECYRKGRIIVIPPGVDLERYRPLESTDPTPPIKSAVERFLREPRKPWILALSRPDERKNIATLVRAYGENEALRERANLVVVAGTRDDISQLDAGPKRVLTELLALIDRYDLYGKVAYPKQHAPEDVPDLYRLASSSGGVFVNPALTEPFGLTLLEAAASGLPVVATDDGGPRDILRICKNGLLIDPLDASAMGNALLDALSDRRRWGRWKRNGLQNVHRHFTWTSHVERYLTSVGKSVTRRDGREGSTLRTRLTGVDRLLACGLDGALIGDAQSWRRLYSMLEEHGEQTGFCIVTGRPLKGTLTTLRKWQIPRPDVLVAAAGSEIYYGEAVTADPDWSRQVDYRWDKEAVLSALDGIKGLRLQPSSMQASHKVSYYVDTRTAPTLRQIREHLRREGLDVNVIHAHVGYMDVLPIRASKGLAVRYIADKWGIPIERVLTAADSADEFDMLTGKSLGVLIADHDPTLDRLRGRKRVFMAKGRFAKGVVEGIAHYDFLGDIRQPEWREEVAPEDIPIAIG